MCGITGFVDFSFTSDLDVLRKMNDVLIHRGPDDSGLHIFNNEEAVVGIGHRRLSILDLSEAGHQPMFDISKRYCIAFNGEVYNYREIKEELVSKGYSFFSETDTEVVLKSFIEWREKCVEKFIGMFAFSIFDDSEKKLYLFRDRAGVKPLYYYSRNSLFMFSSEIKSFHQNREFSKTIDNEALSEFFNKGYISFPKTIFADTFKLEPGNILIFNIKNRRLEKIQYWSPVDVYNEPKIKIDYKSALDEFERILISSFNYRMISDVPVGVFLSGGYDSTAVAALIQKHSSQKINTFTIGFEDKRYDESDYARKISSILGTNHSEYICNEKEMISIIPKLPDFFDEPFGDSSSVPTYLVSREAKRSVSVALSADGADEVLFGYNKYFDAYKLFTKLSNSPLLLRKIVRFMLGLLPKGVLDSRKYYNLSSRYSKFLDMLVAENVFTMLDIVTRKNNDDELKSYISADINVDRFSKLIELSEDNDNIDRILAYDYWRELSNDMLVKVDRATMSVSLEGREPFLDNRIVEYTSRLPSEFKFDGKTRKKILKDLVHRYIPENVMNRPKKGFSVPMDSWLKGDLKEYVDHYVSKDELSFSGLLNVREIIDIKNKYYSGIKIKPEKIWLILVFQMWYEKWMK